MRAMLAFVFVLLLALPAIAGVLKLEDGTQVAVQISRGTQKSSQETFVLVNGLIYATSRWNAVARGLADSGATVVRYALPGQPENLRLLAKGEEPAHFARGLTLTDMAENLRRVLRAARIMGPVHLVGLSYGASVASEFARLYPAMVKDVTFVSPLVISTDEYDAGGLALREWLEGVRFWENSPCTLYGAFNPFLCTAQDYWYDSFYKAIYQTYLNQRIDDIPKGLDEAVYKKAVFHLVRAARDFDLRKTIAGLHKVSMFVGALEEKQLAQDQRLAWQAVPEAERVSFRVFKGAHHALPDESPDELIEQLLGVAQHQLTSM